MGRLRPSYRQLLPGYAGSLDPGLIRNHLYSVVLTNIMALLLETPNPLEDLIPPFLTAW